MVKVLFASNNVTDWTATTADNTATRFDGTRVPYAMNIPDNSNVAMAHTHPAPSGDTVWYGWQHYQHRNSHGGLDGYFASVYDAAGDAVAGINMIDGNLYVQAFGDTVTDGGNYLLLGHEVILRMDLEVQVTASDITVTLYIAGGAVSTATAANTAGGKGVARRFAFELQNALDYPYVAAFSEFVAAESNTTSLRVTKLDPAVAGNYSQWAGNIAELADDNLVTGVTSSAIGHRNSATVDVLGSSNTISAVVGVATASADINGPQHFRQFLRKNSTDYDGTSVPLSLSNSFAVECWEVDPSTGAPWVDESAVNACELGVESLA